jgi:hypothetical protein
LEKSKDMKNYALPSAVQLAAREEKSIKLVSAFLTTIELNLLVHFTGSWKRWAPYKELGNHPPPPHRLLPLPYNHQPAQMSDNQPV